MNQQATSGRVGVFCVGMGAVASTMIAGVELARRAGRVPVGSLSELGAVPGEAAERRWADVLPLAPLDALVFGGVDLIETDAAGAARTAGVLDAADLAATADFLATVKAGRGLHDPGYVRLLPAVRARPETGKRAQLGAMVREYRAFFAGAGCARGVVLLTLSTEAWRDPGELHATPEAFLAAVDRDDPAVSPSQLYAWAALEAGYPVVNCTPNPVLDAPAIVTFAERRGLPIAGSDLKSGQTYMKTIVGAALGKRLLGVHGWFSTNILGNRDGLVLDEPQNFRAKEITKGGVLDDLLDAKRHPELYAGMEHQVHIHYYPPKGDNKEAWDAIQLFGWLGYGMELKINFQCRDSILAAPLVLDLARFIDLAAQKGAAGVQSWLGNYFKNPAPRPGEIPTNDVHVQLAALERQLLAWR